MTYAIEVPSETGRATTVELDVTIRLFGPITIDRTVIVGVELVDKPDDRGAEVVLTYQGIGDGFSEH